MRMKLYRIEVERSDQPVISHIVAPTEKRAVQLLIDQTDFLGEQFDHFSVERIDASLARSLIYPWRRAALRHANPVFVPAVLMDEPPEQASEPIVAAVLDPPDGGRLRIFASASPALTAAVLKAMR